MTFKRLVTATLVLDFVLTMLYLAARARVGTEPNLMAGVLHIGLGLSGILAAAWAVWGLNHLADRVRRRYTHHGESRIAGNGGSV